MDINFTVGFEKVAINLQTARKAARKALSKGKRPQAMRLATHADIKYLKNELKKPIKGGTKSSFKEMKQTIERRSKSRTITKLRNELKKPTKIGLGKE